MHNSGTAYEIGWQHATSDPDVVRQVYDAFVQPERMDPSRLDVGVRVVAERLQRFFPETLEEVQGIADGACLTRGQVLTLNCLVEVLGCTMSMRSCSNIGFKNSDAGPLLGKTADWRVTGADRFGAWQRYQPAPGAGHSFIHYGCAGTLWTEGGLNDVGLGMVLNGLPSWGLRPDGVPWLPLPRGVLQHCGTVREAVAFLGRHDVMCWGFNLTLADANGNLSFIELVPGAQAFRQAASDYVIHTNHCLSQATADRQVDEEGIAGYGFPGLLENSRARYRTLERIVPPAARTVATMKDLLRDRSATGAISQSGEHGFRTVYAMVIAPAQGKMWGAEGYPPDVEFVEYDV